MASLVVWLSKEDVVDSYHILTFPKSSGWSALTPNCMRNERLLECDSSSISEGGSVFAGIS